MHNREEKATGSLYRMDADRSVTKIESNICCSNGICWSPDRSTMYHVDSSPRRVFAYDYDLETGKVANRRVVIQLEEDQGYPDGMTMDNEGMIWLAHWGGA